MSEVVSKLCDIVATQILKCHTILIQTRLHFGSFLAKVSRVVSTSKSDVSKIPLLTDRGYPPLLKNHEIPLLSRIVVSHGDRSIFWRIWLSLKNMLGHYFEGFD